MKNESELVNQPAPMVGSEYIKLKTGEMLKWEAYDKKTQTFAFKSSDGKTCSVHLRDVKIPTADEEIDHLKKQISN
jgi:hypothetical protein